MARKFLSKAVAAAAFGGASLLIAAPGIAMAGEDHDRGWVYAWPGYATAGDTVTLVEICKKPQEEPWVWSEATGKVWLEPQTVFNGDSDGGDGKKDKHKKDKHKKHWEEHDWDRKHEKRDHKDPKDPKHGRDHRGSEEGRSDHRDPKDPKRHHEDRKDHHDPKDPKRHHEDRKGHHDPKDPKRDRDHEDRWEWDGERDFDKIKKSFKKHPWAYWAEVEIAEDVAPGKYKLKGSCGEGKLIVMPNGSVDGGDGGAATAGNTALMAGGAGMLAAAALGGTALYRKRSVDGTLA